MDCYAVDHDAGKLTAVAEHLFYCQATPPSTNTRILPPKGSRGLVRAAIDRRDVHIALNAGFSIVVGDRHDPVTHRFYVKRTDAGGNVSLPTGEHRARFEVTLRDNALPFLTTAEWATFRFETLARHFSFRRLETATLPGYLAAVYASRHAPRLGRVDDSMRRSRKQRQTARTTSADIGLNQRTREALRTLTRSQRRLQPRRHDVRRRAPGNRSASGIREEEHKQAVDSLEPQAVDVNTKHNEG